MFHGTLLPVLIYYHADESIDYKSTIRNVVYVLKYGLTWDNSCFIIGSVEGQRGALTLNERLKLMRIISKKVNRRVPIGISVQDHNVDNMLELSKTAAQIGLDFIQISPPSYYYRSSFEDFDDIMKKITNTTDIPILVHNTPWENVVDLSAKQIKILVDKYPQFVGLRWRTRRSVDDYLKVIDMYHKRLQIIDNQNMPVMTHLMGGVGYVSHFANIYPEIAVPLLDLLKQKNYVAAQQHISKYNRLWNKFRLFMWRYGTLELSVVKAALSTNGRQAESYVERLTTRYMNDKDKILLRQALTDIEANYLK